MMKGKLCKTALVWFILALVLWLAMMALPMASPVKAG